MPDFIKIQDKPKLYQAADTANIKAVVGGKNTDHFAPSANVSFKMQSGKEQYWWNICDDIDQVKTVGKEEDWNGNKLKIKDGDVESTFELLDTSLKIERIFHTKPTEAPRYKIESSNGVSLNYQYPLPEQYQRDLSDWVNGGNIPSTFPDGTLENYLSITTRSESVVGSFVVICDKKNHFKDKTGKTIVNYGTGKLGTISTPIWVDSAGKRVKTKQWFFGGVLTCDLPSEDWLDNALYPIFLDPTIGYDPEGTPGTHSTYSGYMTGRYPSTEAGTLDSASVYYNSNVANDTRGIVYESSGDRVAYSSVLPGLSFAGGDFYEYSLNSESISSGDYWLGRSSDGLVPYSYDSAGAVSGDMVFKSGYADPPPDPLTGTSTLARLHGSYLTYTVSGGDVLLPNNLTQAQAIDNVLLTQKNILVVTDLSHPHSIDNVVLETSINLLVNGLTHGHTVENVTLSISDILEVANLLQGQYIENVDLVQANTLAINDLLHNHILDLVLLGSDIRGAKIDFTINKSEIGFEIKMANINFTLD